MCKKKQKKTLSPSTIDFALIETGNKLFKNTRTLKMYKKALNIDVLVVVLHLKLFTIIGIDDINLSS